MDHTYFYRCVPLIYMKIKQVYKGLAKNKLVQFVSKEVSYKQYPIPNILHWQPLQNKALVQIILKGQFQRQSHFC